MHARHCAEGDSRVVAASDFFSFNVQRRESFDDIDRAKGNRDDIFNGPDVTPVREDVGDARRQGISSPPPRI